MTKKTNKQYLKDIDRLALIRTIAAVIMLANGIILSLHIFGVI